VRKATARGANVWNCDVTSWELPVPRGNANAGNGGCRTADQRAREMTRSNKKQQDEVMDAARQGKTGQPRGQHNNS